MLRCSVGNLAYPAEVTQLTGLLQRLTAMAERSKMGAAELSQAMQGLSLLAGFYPGRYDGLAQLPEVAELCSMFVRLVRTPEQLARHCEAWVTMLCACGMLGLNPSVGSGGQNFFDEVLRQLSDVGDSLSPFDAAHALVGLAAWFGLPPNGQLPPALQPHRALLAKLGRRAQHKLDQCLAKHRWRLLPGQEQQWRATVGAFAQLD